MLIRRKDIVSTNTIHNVVTPQIGLLLDLFIDWSSGIIHHKVIYKTFY